MDNKKEEEVKTQEDKAFTILDLVIIFLNNKMRVAIITFIICVLSIILYFFVYELIFTSTASIKSSSNSGGLLGGLDVGGISDISGLDDIGIGGGKSAKELATYEEILGSRKCIEPLIIKFGLKERDEFRFMDDAVKDFKENKLKIRVEKQAGIMYIGVEDKDPILAKDMVDFLIKQLDSINIELSVLNAKNNRKFIENRYMLAREDLRKSEDSLKAFQLVYGVAPDLQIKAAAQSVFGLEAELKAEEVKLDVIGNILSPDQPEVKMQNAKVNSLRNKISEIRTSTDLNDFLKLGNSPQIALLYLRLEREVEIQTKIMSFMLPIYEKAKIDENRETPTIIVLDKPTVADRKTKPKRLTMVVIWTFIGFVFSNMYFILRHKYTEWKKIIKQRESRN